MKKLLLVLLIATAIGCKKEEVLTPQTPAPFVRGVDSLKVEISEATIYAPYALRIEINGSQLIDAEHLSGDTVLYFPAKKGDSITGRWLINWLREYKPANAIFTISYNGNILTKASVLRDGTWSGKAYYELTIIVE